MAEKKKEAEFHIGDGRHLSMKSSTIVEMHDYLKVMTGDAKGITLDVVIKADFDKIPPEYHQLFPPFVPYIGAIDALANVGPSAFAKLAKSGIK